MSNNEILEEALKLRPDERYMVVEGLLNSLDIPDEKIDDIWAEEAVKRLDAYRKGRLDAVPMDEIFNAEL